jgi:DNA-binding response OmpR family regulator
MFGTEPQSAVLLKELANKWPSSVSNDRLVSAMYGWHESESADVRKVIRVRVSRLRHQLRPLGLGIASVYGVGYRLELL